MNVSTPKMIAPDVGTCFEYRGHGFRVDGWLREASALPEPPKDDFLARLLWDVEKESAGCRMVFCRREDATHVSGAGISGCVAPVQDIRLSGRVDWSAKELAQERADALSLVGRLVT